MVTNLILNLHLVVVESMIEVSHVQHYENKKHTSGNKADALKPCDDPESERFGVEHVSEITIYLFPFGIEFVSIASVFFYEMYHHGIGHM